MRDYECAVVFLPTLAGEELSNATKRYAEIITSRGGDLREIDNWGKRSLAYEINYHREGYYLFYRFKGGSEILGELTRQLRIDENVIRHMIVREEAKAPPRFKTGEEVPEARDVRPEDVEEEV